ncbi:cytochrome P450 [Spongiibacter taiwanensis]|uniref:cytochrome P450 n=1 Tax=Spongiibacter taiwanensis TaxID=1748242 RepID=UPI0020362D8A|nr:cytochrome P450 [Spongiibacter taiwanensis]USA42773.1 cytochrome P450 [Spongiibacter taiwanensis]
MQQSLSRPAHVPEHLFFDFDMYADGRISEEVHRDFKLFHQDLPDLYYTPHHGGHWVTTSYDLISQMVQNPAVFSAREMQFPRIENPPLFIPLNLDPPENIPYRQLLMPFFSPRNVRQMEDNVRRWAAEIVDQVADKGECDFMYDVAKVFPVSIFMEFMGMPLARLREFRELAEAFFKAHTQEEFHQLTEQIVGMLTEVIEQKRREPDDKLISYLLGQKIEGRALRLDEIQNMCYLLFLGGMDTVTNVTGFAYRQLAQDKALQARLEKEPECIGNFVEESLRCFGVVNTPRLIVQDIEIGGASLKAGEMILCCLPMAGRDERHNSDPLTFNIDREKFEYLTFSKGPHLCVGHFLARAEIRILTEEWFKRVPAFELVPAADHGCRLGTVMGIDSLPLQW